MRGATPCDTENLKVMSVHPTLDASLSRGPRSQVAPVVGGGQCSLWPVLHQVLESSSSSFKASHLKSVSRRLDPLGASHLCPTRLCPHTPGLRGWVAALAAIWGAPSSLAEAPPPPPPSPVPGARPQLHLLRRPPESCWGQRTHPASPCPQQEAVCAFVVVVPIVFSPGGSQGPEARLAFLGGLSVFQEPTWAAVSSAVSLPLGPALACDP